MSWCRGNGRNGHRGLPRPLVCLFCLVIPAFLGGSVTVRAEGGMDGKKRPEEAASPGEPASSLKRRLGVVDFEELLELASLGASVMHSRAVEIAERFDQPFRVRPSFDDSEGTLVKHIEEDVEQVDVRGAALEEDEEIGRAHV